MTGVPNNKCVIRNFLINSEGDQSTPDGTPPEYVFRPRKSAPIYVEVMRFGTGCYLRRRRRNNERTRDDPSLEWHGVKGLKVENQYVSLI